MMDWIYVLIHSLKEDDTAVFFLFNSSCIFQERLWFQLARVLEGDQQVLDNYPRQC